MSDLDALVAEKVMGWFRKSAPHYAFGDLWIDCDGRHQSTRVQWAPSACVSDAWRVVERMRELGWQLELRDGMSCYVASFIHRDLGGCGWHTKMESAPEAICMSALAALGVDSTPISVAPGGTGE